MYWLGWSYDSTTCLGNDYHYTGCEPFTKTFLGLKKMIKDLNIENQINIYNSPVEDMLDKLKEKDDMCLTSLLLRFRSLFT